MATAVVDATVPEIGLPSERATWQIDIAGLTNDDMRPVKWQFYLSLLALAIGALMGLLQALERLDVNLYDKVGLQSYYQGLTLHGVGLAIVFTFTFSNVFLSLMAMRGYDRPLASRAVSNAALACAWGGFGLAAWAMLANKATVLFTFYPPLQATAAFYIGAVFLVISTWLVLLNQALTLRAWRRDGHRDDRIPLLSYVSIMTSIMWSLASIGIAFEVLAQILPWVFGVTDTIDPQFTRVLFWFTGHPIVYFWLLPVYVSWYLILPKQVSGKIYSDGVVRSVFLAFLLLIPVGVHHQFTDPGIEISSKTIMWILTLCIFYPSLITLFSVVSALETGGRAHGGKGILGWVLKLPWGRPEVAGQLLAGLGFMLGGASGLINASYTMNLEVHNTAFIVGHFHLTVGTAVALSIMALSYLLVPYFTGKQLWGRRLAVAQVWLWFIGVLVFARGQMQGGMAGMPRRTAIADAPYLDRFTHGGWFERWDVANALTGIGGCLMFIASVLFFTVILATIHNRKQVPDVQVLPVVETTYPATRSWAILDRLWLWAGIATAFCLLIYGQAIGSYLPLNPVSPGFHLW